MLGLAGGVWADAGKFIAEELVAASAVEISSPPIRLHTFMTQILLSSITRAERRQQTAVFALAAVEGVGFLIDPAIFRRLLGASYASSAEILIKPFLIDERRSVNDGIAGKRWDADGWWRAVDLYQASSTATEGL
jgi:hypothetical protein